MVSDNITPRQLAETFNDQDTVSIARNRVGVLVETLKDYKDCFRDIHFNTDYDEFTKIFLKKIVKFWMLTDDNFKQYEFLMKYLSIVDMKYRGGSVMGLEDADPSDFPNAKEQFDIETANKFDILDLHDFEKVKRGRTRSVACCPFHVEQTPSMVIYHDSNSFYCFSCQAGGDAIKFAMDLYGLDFVSAVKKLGG